MEPILFSFSNIDQKSLCFLDPKRKRNLDVLAEAIYDTYKLQKDAEKGEAVAIMFRVVNEILQETKKEKLKKHAQFEHLIEVLKGIIEEPEDFIIFATDKIFK